MSGRNDLADTATTDTGDDATGREDNGSVPVASNSSNYAAGAIDTSASDRP